MGREIQTVGLTEGKSEQENEGTIAAAHWHLDPLSFMNVIRGVGAMAFANKVQMMNVSAAMPVT